MLEKKIKFNQIRKRDGRALDFDQSKITDAIFKALTATKEVEKELLKNYQIK